MKNNRLKILTIIIAALLFSSCAHKVSRVGYSEKAYIENGKCEVYIQKEKQIPIEAGEKIGTIKLSDTGFSIACNEVDAIEILKKEACSIGGNLVNITAEKRPSFTSSCYQCTADIYTITNDSTNVNLKPVNHYESADVSSRVDEDKKRNRTIFWSSFAVGFVIGFFIFL